MTVKPAAAPGRFRRAAQLRQELMQRAAAPYVLSYGSALAVAGVAGAALNVPTLAPLPVAVLGAAGAHGAIRLHEASRWHRSGGKAAMRQRRKYQGWATRRDIRRLCRLGPPSGDPLLVLGTARRMQVAVNRENSVLYTGPPGYGKTAALACHAADAPGALFATSTKTSLLLDTAAYRAGKGTIWVLNGDGYGSIPSTLAWSPLDGCEDPQTAQRRAGDFAAASPKSGKTDDGYWAAMGAGLIAVMLHAAAVSGATMREAVAWVRNPHADAVRDAYCLPAADPMLATKLASLSAAPGEHLNSIIGAAEAALAWMDDPVMAAAACPAPGEGFSPREFARSTDSVYLIGKKRPFGSLAPYFAALAAEVFEQLKQHAMEIPAGRLPRPATFVLDEMPLTCPVPVHDMLAEAREYMITITAGAQSLSQLRSVWGIHDGDTIRSASPVEVIFGGEKRHDDLEALSQVIGGLDTWHHVTHADGSRSRQPSTVRLMPPEALHRLAKRTAVILAPACRPVLASTPAIWERPGHQRADLAGPVRQAAAGTPLAITAAVHAAIPVPPARPVPALEPAAVPLPCTAGSGSGPAGTVPSYPPGVLPEAPDAVPVPAGRKE